MGNKIRHLLLIDLGDYDTSLAFGNEKEQPGKKSVNLSRWIKSSIFEWINSHQISTDESELDHFDSTLGQYLHTVNTYIVFFIFTFVKVLYRFWFSP